MQEIIERRRDELTALCRRFEVKSLDLFGSAASGAWLPVKSDLDFVVEFLPLDDAGMARNYFGLLHALEDLFDCRIDLVMDRAIRNPFFRHGVQESRGAIYAA